MEKELSVDIHFVFLGQRFLI